MTQLRSVVSCDGEDDVDEDRARRNQALDLLVVCRAVRPTPEVSGSREALREGLGIGGLVEEEVRRSEERRVGKECLL